MGGKRALTDAQIWGLLYNFDNKQLDIPKLCNAWGVSRATLYNTLKDHGRTKIKKSKPEKSQEWKSTSERITELVKLLDVDASASIPKFAAAQGISRQAVYKAVQRRGIRFPRKGKKSICPVCLVRFFPVPSRKQKFCSTDCYNVWQIALPKLNSSKYLLGQRIARTKLEQYIQLEEEWIIWHSDRNWLYNDIGNLLVFDTFQNLLYYLLWGAVEPIFNGKDVE